LPARGAGARIAGAPGDAPGPEGLGQAPVAWLLRALAQARTDHDVARIAPGRVEHSRDVRGRMLPVAVHGQYAGDALPERLGEPVAQAGALAEALGVAQQRDRQVPDLLDRVVVGTIVDDDDVAAFGQRALHDLPDAQGFVQCGDHHRDGVTIHARHLAWAGVQQG